MQFSEASNKTGLYELFQDLTGTNSSSYTAYKYARDANNALLAYMGIALGASRRGQVDDLNFSTYPELKINIVSGQPSYPITSDADATANQILEIERVECATESTADLDKFQELEIVNELDLDGSLVVERNQSGTPTKVYRRANGLFLVPTPNFSATDGIHIFFNRTPSYFAGTDTTKVAGIPHSHQEYLVYRPAYLYCVTKLPKLANGYLAILQKLEADIKEHYMRRNREDRTIATSKRISFR